MIRYIKLIAAFVLGACIANGAAAQSFSNVIVFGDSLSDSGNIAPTRSLPVGNSFTTNPDPVAAEIVAETFGANPKPSSAGGPNFAWGGACMNAASDQPCSMEYSAVPHVATQISSHLTSRSNQADPNALYMIWGGANDIEQSITQRFTQNLAGLANPQTRAATTALVLNAIQTDTIAAATANATHIVRLKQAGAQNIVVYNMPDIGLTPAAAAAEASIPNFRAIASGMSNAYNQVLYGGLRASEDGIIPMNIVGLFGEVAANPGTYGITNPPPMTACTSPSVSAVACVPEGAVPAGVTLPTWAPGNNRNHLFSDARHPSGVGHEMIANATLATLAAPLQVSLAAEGGTDLANVHRSVTSAASLSDMGMQGEEGAWKPYASVRTGRNEVGNLPRLGGAKANFSTITMGTNSRGQSGLIWGVALSLGEHTTEVAQASVDSNAMIGSLNGIWTSESGMCVSGALSIGTVAVDINRFIQLGTATRREQGSTEFVQTRFDLDIGCLTRKGNGSTGGPFAGISWLDQNVDAYQEAGMRSTAMEFSEFNRDSLVLRVGYLLERNIRDDTGNQRLYMRAMYEDETQDEAINVTAASKTMPGRFTLAGLSPSDQIATLEVGMIMKNEGSTSFAIGYAARFRSDSKVDHRLDFGFRSAF